MNIGTAMGQGNQGISLTTSSINQCVGILNEGTILGTVTLLMLLLITGFALCMMTTISPMDKFENPKDKALFVPIDKSN